MGFIFCYLGVNLGEEASVSLLHQCERKRVVDGVSDSLHQSDWRPAREGGASSGSEEWFCESHTLLM